MRRKYVRQIIIICIFVSLSIIIGCGEEEEKIIPDPVTEIQGELGDRKIILTWEPTKNAIEYAIQRADNADGEYKQIGVTASTQFVDEDVEHNKSYYYKVISISEDDIENDKVTPSHFKYVDKPKLRVSADKLDFGTNKPSKTIEIVNEGTGELKWEITTDAQGWLSFEPSSGTVTKNKVPVVVEVVRKDLPPKPEPYEATITVSHVGGEDLEKISVNMTVPTDPKLGVSRESINFGENSPQETLIISNQGTGTLSWQADCDVAWVKLPEEGSATPGTPSPITIKVFRDNLPPEDYNDTIKITSNGGDKHISVSMTVGETFKFEVIPKERELDFGDKKEPLSFTIKNTGTGKLSWAATTQQEAWITVEPAKGTVNVGDTNEVSVRVDRDMMEPQSYVGTVNVDAGDAGIAQITVKMEVPTQPELDVSTESINFGKDLTQKKVVISNQGTGTLSWQAECDTEWIELSDVKGSATEATPNEMTISVSKDDLPPGKHDTTLKITSNGGDKHISVSMTVGEIFTFKVMPEDKELNFGEKEELLSFTIKNTGTGELSWTATTQQENWIAIEPDEGTVGVDESQEASVTIDRNRVPNPKENVYVGTINVRGGTKVKQISVKAEANPVLYYAPKTLDFGESTDEKIFTIENRGTGTLEWELNAKSAWIGINTEKGNTLSNELSQISIEIVRNRLALGEYSDYLEIKTNDKDETISVHAIGVGTIEGVVLNDITEDSISNATIRAEGLTEVQSKSNGEFTLAFKHDDTYPITVEKAGFIGWQGKVTTTNGQAEKRDYFLHPIPGTAQVIQDNALPFKSPSEIAFSKDGDKAYVTNTGDNTVSVVNALTDTVQRKVSVGMEPIGIAANPVENEFYVANSESNTVSIIDGTTFEVFEVEVGQYPNSLVVSSDGKTLYVTNKDDDAVSVIDLHNRREIDTIQVGSSPEDITISEDGLYLYVANQWNDSVSFVDTRFKQAKPISVGSEPILLSISSSGKYVYAGYTIDINILTILDTASRVAILPIEMEIDGPPGGITCVESHEGDILFITDYYGAKVIIVRIYNTDVTTSFCSNQVINVGMNPRGIAYNESIGKIYVANSIDNTITVLKY